MTITWICSKLHFVLCPNQGYKIRVVFLQRVSILEIFCPKQGQVFTPSVAQLYLHIDRASPRDSVLHPVLQHQSFPFTYSSTVLLQVLVVHAILTLNQHLIALLSIPQSVNQSSLFIHGSSSPSPGATWFGLSIVLALHLGANGRIWLGTSKFIGQVRTLDGLKRSTTPRWKPSSSFACQVLQNTKHVMPFIFK